MMEIDRRKKHMEAPDMDAWNREMYVVRVFDQLIYNTDRNLQNLLIDPELPHLDDRSYPRLPHANHAEGKEGSREVRSRAAREPAEAQRRGTSALKRYITDAEIKGLLARRDKIVEFFDQQVAEKGEGRGPLRPPGPVSYGRSRTLQCETRPGRGGHSLSGRGSANHQSLLRKRGFDFRQMPGQSGPHRLQCHGAPQVLCEVGGSISKRQEYLGSAMHGV